MGKGLKAYMESVRMLPVSDTDYERAVNDDLRAGLAAFHPELSDDVREAYHKGVEAGCGKLLALLRERRVFKPVMQANGTVKYLDRG
jgi:hypothetical protein